MIAAKLIESNEYDDACELLGEISTNEGMFAESFAVFAAIARKKDVVTAMDLMESVSSSELLVDFVLNELIRDGDESVARRWLMEILERSSGDLIGTKRRLANQIKSESTNWRMDRNELGRLKAISSSVVELQEAIVQVQVGRGDLQPAIEFCSAEPDWFIEFGEPLMTRIVDAGLLTEFLAKSDPEFVARIPFVDFFKAKDKLLAGETGKAIEFARAIENRFKKQDALFLCAEQTASPYLEQLRRVDNWLASVLVDDGNGNLLIRDQARQAVLSNSLYSGLPGIALFYNHLYSITGEKRYQLMTNRVLASLEHSMLKISSAEDPGLFTGYTGVARAFYRVRRNREVEIGLKVVDWLAVSAIDVPNDTGAKAVTWNHSTDLISGAAGIGSHLLDWRVRHPQRISLLIAAGEGLLAQAIPLELNDGSTGLKWKIREGDEREMPNLSHGTAGICKFLLELDKFCKTRNRKSSTAEFGLQYDGRFRKAATAGGRYLAQLNAENGTRSILPHHLPAGEKLDYLGWCHGPPGTCQLANLFTGETVSSDFDRYWRAYSKTASDELLQAALHKNRTDGFWENVGLCCGSAGVGSFLLDQSELFGDVRYFDEAERIAFDIIRRGQKGLTEKGLPTICWPSAEHRVLPEQIEAQAGLMQGAAGIGLFLLQLEGRFRGKQHFSVIEEFLN